MITDCLIGYSNQIPTGFEIVGRGREFGMFRVSKLYPTSPRIAIVIEKNAEIEKTYQQSMSAVDLFATLLNDINGTNEFGDARFDANSFAVGDITLNFPEKGPYAVKNHFFRQTGWNGNMPKPKKFEEWPLWETPTDTTTKIIDEAFEVAEASLIFTTPEGKKYKVNLCK